MAGWMLVVDDDPDIRQALADRLRLEGYDVACAANGQEALQHLRAGDPPCLILLDYAMPVMDGRAFREAQLRDPTLAAIPMILITGQLSKAFAARSMDAAAVLEKPVAFETLEPLLRRFGPKGHRRRSGAVRHKSGAPQRSDRRD